MYEYWNPSPNGSRVGDCAVRALSKILGTDWETAYTMLCLKGFSRFDMPNSNAVINSVLAEHGFRRDIIPNTCPDCYTMEDFSKDHPAGRFVAGTGDHVVAVIDGVIYDSWDCSNEVPIFYWQKGED